MEKINQILAAILGDKGEVEQERYFLTMTTFVSSIFLLFLCLFHLIMNLKTLPVYLAGSSSLILLGLYFLLRFHSCLYIPKLVVTLLGLFLLDLTWYSKFLSHGPVLYFIFAFGALVIWVWKGRSLIVMLLIYFLNIALLYIVESQTTGISLEYPDKEIRVVDIYLSFSFYSLLMIFLLSRIKNDFVFQKEKAIRSDKLKTAFLANISHEIRTPINSIVGFSKLLEKESSPMKRNEFVNIIQNCSSNLMYLINDLIDLSKIEAGELNFSYSNFLVKDLLVEMKETYTLELQKKASSNVELNYFIQDESLMLYSDPFRVKQVLSNLIRNAIKFTARGTITFGCKRVDNEVVFSVVDTGTGIPEADQRAIFQRFTKYNYNDLNTEGTGIGLSIAEKIVKMFKGRIWLTSTLGEGSSFFFSIPFVQGAESEIVSHKEQRSCGAQTSKPGRVVLIVEDDLASTILLSEMLFSFEVNVHHVEDGKKAIEFITQNPDTALILMDIKLPVMDGYEATAAIKKLFPAIPIIAQTAYVKAGDKEKAISVGCDEYLTKPINTLKFQELLRAYL
jgi:signal transduction histidine kinase